MKVQGSFCVSLYLLISSHFFPYLSAFFSMNSPMIFPMPITSSFYSSIYSQFSTLSFFIHFPIKVSKGCLKAIEILEIQFPDLVLVAISGNMCTDKKPSAINW